MAHYYRQCKRVFLLLVTLHGASAGAQAVNVDAIVSAAELAGSTELKPTSRPSIASSTTSMSRPAQSTLPPPATTNTSPVVASSPSGPAEVPPAVRQGLDSGNQDKIIAVALGSALGALLVAAVLFVLVFWWRRHRSAQLHGSYAPADGGEKATSTLTHRPWTSRWRWRRSGARSRTDEDGASSEVAALDLSPSRKRTSSLTPLTTHGGFWDASEPAQFATDMRTRAEEATAQHFRRQQSLDSQSQQITQHNWSGNDGFEQTALIGGKRYYRVSKSTGHVGREATLPSVATDSGAVERTNPPGRPARYSRGRSVSMSDGRPTAYPSLEEINRFSFGFRESATQGSLAPEGRTAAREYDQWQPRDFVDFLEAHRRASGIARQPVGNGQTSEYRLPGPWTRRI